MCKTTADNKIDTSEYVSLHQKVKNVFHAKNIHNVTIDIEYVNHDELDTHACFSRNICGEQEAWCCEQQPRKTMNLAEKDGLDDSHSCCSHDHDHDHSHDHEHHHDHKDDHEHKHDC